MNRNFLVFEKDIRNLIIESKKYKRQTKYENELDAFLVYLRKNNVDDRILKLSTEDIDDYLLDCINISKITTKGTLETHIAALKYAFQYLIKLNYRYDDLLGYLFGADIKNKNYEILDDIAPKEIISLEKIHGILDYLNNYLDNEQGSKHYAKIQVVSIYIKLNILLPLKPSGMFDLCFSNFDKDFKTITYNHCIISIPRSLGNEIKKVILNMTSKHAQDDLFFKAISQNDINTAKLSNWFSSVLSYIGIDPSTNLPRGAKLKRDGYSYPVESIKTSVIYHMINHGANILFLSYLTGLSLETLNNEINIKFDKASFLENYNSTLANIRVLEII